MDSVAAIVACMQAAADKLGLEPIPAARIRDTIGLGLHDTLDRLVPEGDDELKARVVEGYRRLWFAGFRDRPAPFPEVGETLEKLTERGHLLAVATGKGRRGLDRDFETTGLGHYFHASRTADEAFPKPHPKMLLDLLDELGARPAETLMIGDTTHDLEMAANAGVPALAVTCGSHGRGELERLSPLDCLPGIAELVRWLEGSE